MRTPLWYAGLAFALTLPAPLPAQTLAGSLVGRIHDAAGAPVSGARITVLPARRVAISRADGRFTIAALPPGTYALTVTYPDGGASDHAGIAVLEGEATEVIVHAVPGGGPPRLQIEPGDRRAASTVRALGGEALRNLPVDDLDQALLLLSGVAEPEQAGTPVLRGGGSAEASVWLDGVPLRTGRGRAFGLGIAPNALAQVAVRTGPLSAAFGDAQSGVISLLTRSGGPGLRGDLSYETDNLFGSGVSLGHNRFEGTAGGTLADRVSFFLGGTLAGRAASPAGAGVSDVAAFVPGAADTVVTDATDPNNVRQVDIPRFVRYTGDCDAALNAGASCHGRQLPYDWTTAFSISGKVEWRYGARSSLALTGLRHVAQDRFWPAALAFNPDAQFGTRSTGVAWVLGWTQALGGETGPTVQAALSRQSARAVAETLRYGRRVPARVSIGGHQSRIA